MWTYTRGFLIMGKPTIDKVRQIKYINSRLKGVSKTQSLRDAGYAETTAKTMNTDKTSNLVKTSERLVIKELSSPETIKIYKKLLASKLELEQRVYDNALSDKDLTREQQLKIMNKTKDNIEAISKTVRLLEGQSTENIKVDDDRQSRLASMMQRLTVQNKN